MRVNVPQKEVTGNLRDVNVVFFSKQAAMLLNSKILAMYSLRLALTANFLMVLLVLKHANSVSTHAKFISCCMLTFFTNFWQKPFTHITKVNFSHAFVLVIKFPAGNKQVPSPC